MDIYNPHRATRRSSRRKKQEAIFIVLLGAALTFLCAASVGFALYLGGFNPLVFPFQLTATAISQKNASCQALIDRAIQASGDYCSETDSNNICYGNTTIKAELAPNATSRFAERGDIVGVNELRRLSAAPLDLHNEEWGIAVFKLIANLPRSLPGETVTMVAFGSTTLDNQSGNMESFYFFSELGQITCEAVPFDGLMIDSPDGSGIRMNVNGAELTLMGDASLKATRNGQMEVSMLNGSGRIVANGQEQYFGAGQKVRVGLGGENGAQSITTPSAPEPLTQQELNTACTMTGQYCSQSEVIPVSEAQAQQQLQAQITVTPSPIPTDTLTHTPTPSVVPTNTSFVLPSWTPRWTETPTIANTALGTPTRTPTRTPTKTPTRTPTRTNTPVLPTSASTNTPTPTHTTTNTPGGPTDTPTATSSSPETPTQTPTATQTATDTSTQTPTFTATSTPTNTPTPTSPPTGVPSEPPCSSVSVGPLTTPNSNDLEMDIDNASGTPMVIARFYAQWVESPPSQRLDQLLLQGVSIWDTSDPNSPSDIPSEGAWKGSFLDRRLPAIGVRTLNIQFGDTLQPGLYQVYIVFTGCQVNQSVTLP
jgi:hypothetical protein